MQCSPTNSKKARLLCVDDDPQFLRLFAAVLEAAEYSVVATDDPRTALDLATGASFDLVIADYDMPYMNGAELASRIKQHKCHLPVILFSGNASLPAEVLSLVDGHLVKGEGVELLLQALSTSVHSPIHKGRHLQPHSQEFVLFPSRAMRPEPPDITADFPNCARRVPCRML